MCEAAVGKWAEMGKWAERQRLRRRSGMAVGEVGGAAGGRGREEAAAAAAWSTGRGSLPAQCRADASRERMYRA